MTAGITVKNLTIDIDEIRGTAEVSEASRLAIESGHDVQVNTHIPPWLPIEASWHDPDDPEAPTAMVSEPRPRYSLIATPGGPKDEAAAAPVLFRALQFVATLQHKTVQQLVDEQLAAHGQLLQQDSATS